MPLLAHNEKSLVRLAVDKATAEHLMREPLGTGQVVTITENDVFLDVFLEINDQLVEWVRSMGPKVEVVYPPGLREFVRCELTRALHQYRLV